MSLEYKTKDGIVLKGFSQVDLDKLNKNLKWLIGLMCFGLFFLVTTIIWILWQIKKYKIVTYLIQSLK